MKQVLKRISLSNKTARSKRILLLLLVCFVSITGTLLARRSISASTNPSTITTVSAAPVPQADSHRAQLVRVWVHAEEIYPSVVYVKPGRVLLRAENQSQTDIALVLERVIPGQGRQAVTRINTTRHAKRVDGELVLGVGEYTFFEESQPDFKGTLVVEPE